MIKQTGIALFAALPFLAFTAPPASSAIQCEGRWQIVQGNSISTPYCEDSFLAAVAQRAGSRVTARQIRQNPLTKQKVCHLVGFDPAVADICFGFTPDGDGTRG